MLLFLSFLDTYYLKLSLNFGGYVNKNVPFYDSLFSFAGYDMCLFEKMTGLGFGIHYQIFHKKVDFDDISNTITPYLFWRIFTKDFKTKYLKISLMPSIFYNFPYYLTDEKGFAPTKYGIKFNIWPVISLSFSTRDNKVFYYGFEFNIGGFKKITLRKEKTPETIFDAMDFLDRVGKYIYLLQIKLTKEEYEDFLKRYSFLRNKIYTRMMIRQTSMVISTAILVPFGTYAGYFIIKENLDKIMPQDTVTATDCIGCIFELYRAIVLSCVAINFMVGGAIAGMYSSTLMGYFVGSEIVNYELTEDEKLEIEEIKKYYEKL
uniref:Uncharacterized protein n=1 Tax=candidate division WOR-3 bacterium TaxID=2052148 RepID=A0A7C4Y5Q0_UNCW3